MGQGAPTNWALQRPFNIIVASTRRLSGTDINLLRCKTETELLQKAAEKKYEVMKGKEFTLIFYEDLFNLHKAEEQKELLAALVKKFDSGKPRQTLSIKDLDPKSQAGLRNVLSQDPSNAQLQFAANSPDLKFQVVPSLTMDFDYKGKQVSDFRVDPYVDGPTDAASRKEAFMHFTPQNDPRSAKAEPKQSDWRTPSDSLSFFFSSTDTRASKKSKWAQEAAKLIEDRCTLAESEFDQVTRTLLDKLLTAYPDSFGNLPTDRNPKLTDLGPKAQEAAFNNIKNWSGIYGFGSGSEAQSYFTNATTTGASLDLSLRIHFFEDSGPNWTKSQEVIVSLSSPLGR